MDTEVQFGPSGTDVETYFCWTKALPSIFIRRHREPEDQRVVQVPLSGTPASLHIIEYTPVASAFQLAGKGGIEFIMCVGTVQGKVELWFVGQNV